MWLTRRSRICGQNAFWGILYHEQQVIACCKTHSDYGPPKMSLKLTVQNSQIHSHCLPLRRKYAPEVKAAKGLKRCRAMPGKSQGSFQPRLHCPIDPCADRSHEKHLCLDHKNPDLTQWVERKSHPVVKAITFFLLVI